MALAELRGFTPKVESAVTQQRVSDAEVKALQGLVLDTKAQAHEAKGHTVRAAALEATSLIKGGVKPREIFKGMLSAARNAVHEARQQ